MTKDSGLAASCCAGALMEAIFHQRCHASQWTRMAAAVPEDASFADAQVTAVRWSRPAFGEPHQFSEVFRRARAEGPQWVTRQNKEAVVILPAEDCERL